MIQNFIDNHFVMTNTFNFAGRLPGFFNQKSNGREIVSQAMQFCIEKNHSPRLQPYGISEVNHNRSAGLTDFLNLLSQSSQKIYQDVASDVV
ncbi:hypothetical protein DESA109040_15735 [Deinococcus saxicola]